MDMYEGTSLWVKDIRLNVYLLFNGIAIFKSEDENSIAHIFDWCLLAYCCHPITMLTKLANFIIV